MAIPRFRLVLLATFLQVLAHARTEKDITTFSHDNLRAATAEQKACPSTECVDCERKDQCNNVCSELNGVKSCRCQCYQPCTDKSNCTGSTVGKAASCQKDLKVCRVYYNIGQCAEKGYPCTQLRHPESRILIEESIVFYKKCTIDAECMSSQKNCAKLGSKYMAKCDYFPAENDRFCACVIAGTTKGVGVRKCKTSNDCLECKYNLRCDKACVADKKGTKTCLCKCRQPCTSVSDCPVNGELKGEIRRCIHSACLVDALHSCPADLISDYPCKSEVIYDAVSPIEVHYTFIYNKCTTDDDCTDIMKTCDQVQPGIGCSPQCMKYNEKSSLCYCVCPGPNP